MSRKWSRALFLLTCALGIAAPFWPSADASPSNEPFPGWASLVSSDFRRVPLSSTERDFTSQFPGRMARFRRDDTELVVRWITSPTRRLHSPADCLRGDGFEVERLPRSTEEPAAAAWRATRNHERVRVEAWIEDAEGRRFDEVGAWYWAALWGRSRGPWVAYTWSQHESQAASLEPSID